MKVTIKKVLMLFFLLLVTLFNSGCSDSNLTGDVFVVKGNGDIKPLAGGKVYLLPYKSEAEFLYKIANDTYATIIPEISETVKLLSRKALDIAQKRKENLDKEIASINGKYSTPPSDCNDLDSQYETMTQKTAQLTETHNKLISEFQKEIKVEKSDKKKKLQKVADEIDSRIRKKVTVTVSQNGYTVKYTIHNNTAYGIVLRKIVLNYDGIKIKEGEARYLSTFNDTYGFDTNMHIMPNKSRTFNMNIILKQLSMNPELKLLHKTGKLKTVKAQYIGNQYPLINKVMLKYDLYKISSKKDENKIVYKKTPVNFTNLALKEESFSSFDNKIVKIQQQLDTENKKFINNDTIKQKLEKQKELKECQKDTASLAEINKKISKLSKIINTLVQSKDEVVNYKQITAAIESIKVLNSDFGGAFKLPVIHDKYTKLVTYNVAKELSESIQTDTSIKGAYSFEKVKNGNYLLLSEYNDSFVHGLWIKEIVLNKDTKIDLNNNTMVDTTLIKYLSRRSEDMILK